MALGVALALFVALLVWSLVPGEAPEGAPPVAIELVAEEPSQALERLTEAGLVESPRLLGLYWALLVPSAKFAPGEHLLRRGLSPRELSARLARLPGRSSAKVTVPEGWHRKKIALRLEKAEVCSASAFLAAAQRPDLLAELRIPGESAEGYLFPATYELAHNTPADEVIARMVKETRRRLEPLLTKHAEQHRRLREVHGFEERDLLTLGSIIERETAHADERPLIASVFLNRLTAKDGETRGRLQSDPTAAYGCEYEPDRAPSCAEYQGRVSPAMLRDPENRYNTYRHAGLPPGPIGSPGLGALEAVLAPAASDYLFFVADGLGKHSFSRTFEEHQAAVARLRASRAAAVAPPAE